MINNRQNNRRRGRGGGPRPNGGGNGQDRGNRIDNRARGNATQLYEKYKTLARDAQMQGDRVLNEYYLQFADHYFRILNENRARFDDPRRRDDRFDREDSDGYDEDGEAGEADNSAPRSADVRDSGDVRDNERSASEPGNHAPRREVRGDVSEGYPGAGNSTEDDEADSAPRRSRQPGRPRTAAQSEELPLAGDDRIEIDRLPPSFAPPSPLDEQAVEAPKPKRRGRPPRAATVEV